MAGPGEGDPDAELELTDSEKNEILEMRNTPQVNNVRCPFLNFARTRYE